jgi:hypothetical protein
LLVSGKAEGLSSRPFRIGHVPTPWSPRLRVVLVDWQNLRLSLTNARRQAGPIWILRSLVDEARRMFPDPGPDSRTVVWVFLRPPAEPRADRALLDTVALGDPSLEVHVCCLDGDLIAMELALRAADAWHTDPAGAVAIVTDTGRLASVARHYEGREGRRPPWLLHLHERPPTVPNRPGRPVSSRRLKLPLDEVAEPRGWTRWDRRAWALRRLAGHADAAVAKRSLRQHPGRRGDDWHDADLRTGVRLHELERVDELVAGFWRLASGGPLARDRAVAEAVRLGVAETETGAAVDALLAAQLVRWHDRHRLEVAPGWREGLLLPMRRVVLRLARQADLSWPLDELRKQHRRCFLDPSRPLTHDPELQRRIEEESRVDSWRWVRYALLKHLGVVEEHADWDANRSRWVLTPAWSSDEFAGTTVERARRVRERLQTPLAVDRLEAELEREERIARPRRWLQGLRDAGLVRRRADRYEWVRGAELPPA